MLAFRVIKVKAPPTGLAGGLVKILFLLTIFPKSFRGLPLNNTLFVFDEPTTGLHFHDIKKLLKSFNALIEIGHSIIVVEHNLELIKCADHIIDLGPDGGENGGQIVATGTPEDIIKLTASITGQYLKDKLI